MDDGGGGCETLVAQSLTHYVLIGHFLKRFLFLLSHMSLIHMSINPSKFGVTLVRFGVGKVVLKVCVVA